MKVINIFLVTLFLASCSFNNNDKECCKKKTENSNEITIVGAMKEVMHEGKLEGKIHLDTISNKINLYGLGPIEGLKGEIMIFDGVCYTSKYKTDSSATIENDFNVKAPFFGYAHISKWSKINLPDSVKTIAALDLFLNSNLTKIKQPFFFKLNVEIEEASLHIMNLPDGVIVTSPEVAHAQGQKHYQLQNRKVTLLGFFSTEHQTIFTHHDTYCHIHLLTEEKDLMGHLDEFKIKSINNIIEIQDK